MTSENKSLNARLKIDVLSTKGHQECLIFLGLILSVENVYKILTQNSALREKWQQQIYKNA